MQRDRWEASPVDTVRLWLEDFLTHFLNLPLLTQSAIVLLIVAGSIVHLFAFNDKTAHEGPALFTTAGIFFTFVGVADGLYSFDVTNIEASVPGLLAGLKTAFLASVVGVFLALSFKLRALIVGVPPSAGQESSSGGTVDDLINQIGALHRSIAGDDKNSLVSEIRLQRRDTVERLDAVRRSLTDFTERAAENNSKALVEALREVIRDFNSKISEQFGDNFKQLNAAVGRLLEWQSTYRMQLTELIEYQSGTARDMELSASAFQSLVANSQGFSEASNSLVTMLTSLNEQRSQIQASIESLGQLLATASTAVPAIERSLMTLTEQMTFGVNQHQKMISNALAEGATSLHGASSELKKAMMDALQAHNQETNNHLRQLSDRTSENIAKLDLALEKELTKSISGLGGQLTALSKQFVDDYAPLVDRLRELTR